MEVLGWIEVGTFFCVKIRWQHSNYWLIGRSVLNSFFFLLYFLFFRRRAEASGHGTHVAGTLAGAQSGEDAGDHAADGMAFQGKLAVFDFGDSDNFNVLSTPDEVLCKYRDPFVRSFVCLIVCLMCVFHLFD